MASTSANPQLRLVGGLYIGRPGEVVPWLKGMFARFSEVVGTRGLTRQIQYASGIGEDDYVRFIGVEVERVETIPDGMTAWEIKGDIWTVLRGRDGVNAPIWQETLAWTWLDELNLTSPCGEFTVRCPDEWNRGEASLRREFRMVSNSYLGAPCNDEIRLVDYDPAWPGVYEQMRQRIAERLGPDIALRIEHFGSTSIPGTPAKPVIDILVEIPSFDAVRQRAIPAFNTPEIEYWCSDHLKFYCRDKITGVRTHHIHMAPAGHTLWEGIAFRDHMRAHPDDAARYVALKRTLARRHSTDRLAYTDGKGDFVREMLNKALDSQPRP